MICCVATNLENMMLCWEEWTHYTFYKNCKKLHNVVVWNLFLKLQKIAQHWCVTPPTNKEIINQQMDDDEHIAHHHHILQKQEDKKQKRGDNNGHT